MHGTKNSQATQNENRTPHDRGGKGKLFLARLDKSKPNIRFVVRYNIYCAKKRGGGGRGF